MLLLLSSTICSALREHLQCLAAPKAAAEHMVVTGFPAPLAEQAKQKPEQDKSDFRGNTNPKGSKSMVGFGRWD